jgi:hypothetical protein
MSDDKPDQPPARPQAKTRIFKPRNKLKAKVTSGQQPLAPGEEGGFSKAALEKAEAELADAAARYAEWSRATLDELMEFYREASTGAGDVRQQAVRKISHIAHELRGQGGTFGYPLVTSFASSLFRFTENDSAISDERLMVIKAHCDAIRVVLLQNITGDGGEIGQALVKALQQGIEKFQKS